MCICIRGLSGVTAAHAVRLYSYIVMAVTCAALQKTEDAINSVQSLKGVSL